MKLDLALQRGARGARKLLVTELFTATEETAKVCEWTPPTQMAKCPVHVTPDTEIAVFTQEAPQDRHYHRKATETYVVLDGDMGVEVEGQLYDLSAGDVITIFPDAVHEVKRDRRAFLCLAFTVNCEGSSDKVVVGTMTKHNETAGIAPRFAMTPTHKDDIE